MSHSLPLHVTRFYFIIHVKSMHINALCLIHRQNVLVPKGHVIFQLFDHATIVDVGVGPLAKQGHQW